MRLMPFLGITILQVLLASGAFAQAPVAAAHPRTGRFGEPRAARAHLIPGVNRSRR
jgi:hypothetical protein